MPSRSLLFALINSLLLSGCAKVVVVPVPTKGTIPADGVLYALPNTVVRVQLKVDRTEKTGGDYAPYAAIFAPDAKPTCKDKDCTAEGKSSFSFQQGATFASYGEPDPSNVFLVRFTGRGAIDQTISMTWNEAGLLSAASSAVTNRTTDIVTSGLKLLAGLGTKAALGAPNDKIKAEITKCSDIPGLVASGTDAWAIPILSSNSNPTAKIFLIANYCAVKKEDRDNLPQNTQMLTQATLYYENRVFPLQNTRTSILNATSITSDASAILTRVEAELTQQLSKLYLGTKSTTTWDGILDVRSINTDTPLAVLHLDPAKGFCVTSAEIPPDAKPIPEKFTLTAADCQSAPPVNLQFAYHPARNNQLFSKITDVASGERSFRYRIPAQVAASLGDDKKVYASGLLWIAQLGTVVSLPAERHSKMLSYDLSFVEATGALKTFKLGTTGGLDAATVDALSSVGGTLLDYRNTVRKQEDELTVLTRQDQLLKLRDEICTIQKKYGLPCTVEPQ
jgi:hypothetical protein